MSRLHSLYVCLGMTLATNLAAQSDPGPRPGAPGAGGAYPGLDPAQVSLFMQGQTTFMEVDSVSAGFAQETGSGLGPTFNGNSCAMCHAQPAVGGSSPGLSSPQNPVPNPQVALASLHGAHNVVPPFITAKGPVREARFISSNPSNSSAALDGGVHGLFTVKGRSDAAGCGLEQTDFGPQLASHNVIFRIPTPIFGLGLVENTPDAVLQANLTANQALKSQLGIGGRLNTSGNDGTVTRFGWKAQNKSLIIFAGEAYNVEQGVSNYEFPNERSAVSGCVFNGTPEDTTDVEQFADFMRFSAPPMPVAKPTSSQQNGLKVFNTVGCALCHSPSLTTAASAFAGMSNVTYQPYSDFALHHMGANLADGILQGGAGPDEFRTAPLWGAGQRLFFLHDGRASGLIQAIQAHSSPGPDCVTSQSFVRFQANGDMFQPMTQGFVCGSEANQVIQNFNALHVSDKQDLLNFLRSL